MTKKTLSKNKGFTLVELIVVLVILAILAAILVPTLLGYIDKARSEKDFATAQAVRVATQAQIDELYGKGIDDVKKNNLDDNAKKAIYKLVGADSNNKIDGQEISIADITITSNQISSITVKIGDKYYKYDSSTNTWAASTAPTTTP